LGYLLSSSNEKEEDRKKFAIKTISKIAGNAMLYTSEGETAPNLARVRNIASS
jgi:hypothetical protein